MISIAYYFFIFIIRFIFIRNTVCFLKTSVLFIRPSIHITGSVQTPMHVQYSLQPNSSLRRPYITKSFIQKIKETRLELKEFIN